MNTKDIIRFSKILEYYFDKMTYNQNQSRNIRIKNSIDDILLYKQLFDNHYRELKFCKKLNLTSLQKTTLYKEKTLIQSLLRTSQNTKNKIQQNDIIETKGIKYYFNQIKGLQNIFGIENVSLDIKHKVLSCVTKRVTLEDRDLGRYEIFFYPEKIYDLSASSSHSYIRVDSIDGTYCTRDEEICHPHVRSGEICLGSNVINCKMAIRESDIIGPFDIINNILHTYNANSPFASLESWDDEQITCEVCGHQIYDEEYTNCTNGCHSYLCDDCCGYCESCREYYCYNCLRECVNCQTYSCSDCLHSCFGCDETNICENCIEACECCRKPFCNECLCSCQKCQADFCKNCLEECEKCQADFCNNCLKKCEKCGQMLCEECSQQCCEEETT